MASYLFKTFSPFDKKILAISKANATGSANVCVVVLEDEDEDERAIEGQYNSTLAAKDCVVLSNSMSPSGVSVTGRSKIEADLICASGGFEGNASNFDPVPTTDCPVTEDPLLHRPAPEVGMCDFYDVSVGEQTRATTRAAIINSFRELAAARRGRTITSRIQYEEFELEPGVYCGGIEISSNSDVTLKPGNYILKDGPLRVRLGGKITGENVSFYMTGNDATFHFGPDSKISLTAPEDGLMAGILFFEDREAPADRVHRILSDDARTLLGTFYLPRGNLSVATLFPVADQSAYTAIVTNKLSLNGSPTLVLNSDYAATTIPVPSGLGPTGGTVTLRE